MSHATDKIASDLGGILTQYLANNWVKSPSARQLINADTNMVTELQLDSFQVMEFILEVEDHFDVAIDLESLSNIQTIRDLAKVVMAAQRD